jgi:hypothetical protein
MQYQNTNSFNKYIISSFFFLIDEFFFTWAHEFICRSGLVRLCFFVYFVTALWQNQFRCQKFFFFNFLLFFAFQFHNLTFFLFVQFDCTFLLKQLKPINNLLTLHRQIYRLISFKFYQYQESSG